MTHKYLPALALAALLCPAFAGCDSDDVEDVVPGSQSREERIRELADTACDRYEDTDAGCPGFGSGEGQAYLTEEDCVRDFETKASQLWPVDLCSEEQIDGDRFARCEDSARVVACAGGSMVDSMMALPECQASAVCVD
ncbi:MAG TPA: DUF6184 family natural product biosynthesis lipoprotein [Polyangiaceae bacterium]|nr:DUF6184 family natural product biosynthesis lipoprotein [Polyangiaceae bacterium]